MLSALPGEIVADRDFGRGTGRNENRPDLRSLLLERSPWETDAAIGQWRLLPSKGHAMMDRRSLLKSLAAGVGAALFSTRRSDAALPKARIARVKCWAHPSMNRSFNQSSLLVTVETDIGVTGIGEGG